MPIQELHDVRVLVCKDQGTALTNERDANVFMSAAWEHGASMIALPVTRLTDDFFSLSTRIAGEIAQKFANYNLRLAVVGDISRHLAASKSLHDFVFEANCGHSIWFVENLDDLERRLARRAA
jgi:hypothetical protein